MESPGTVERRTGRTSSDSDAEAGVVIQPDNRSFFLLKNVKCEGVNQAFAFTKKRVSDIVIYSVL